MRLSNLKKNTERKYDEINPSSSLEYVHETFCPLLILDEMGDCTCYTCPKNTGTTDNLAWTSALLNEFCIAHFFYRHKILSLLPRVSPLCSRERKRGPGIEEEEPPDLLNDVLNIFWTRWFVWYSLFASMWQGGRNGGPYKPFFREFALKWISPE